MSTLATYLGYKFAEDKAPWEANKHHRADNGRFTSGSGRGKAKVDDNRDSHPSEAKQGDEGNGRKEMSEGTARKIIRAAFHSANLELKGMSMVKHAIRANSNNVNEDNATALNKHLEKHGLCAKVDKGESAYRIAEDGYDDISIVDDPVLNVLVGLCQLGMLAKDLHYRAKGKPFYALHELADIVCDIHDLSDDLNEVYYMGEKASVPPERALVSSKAAELIDKNGEEDAIIAALIQVCDGIVKAVETAKSKEHFASGSVSVLDEISKKSLQAKGLLIRTQKNAINHQANNEAIDKVINKGIVLTGLGNAQ